MSAELTVTGVNELIKELTKASDDVRAGASEILREEVTAAADELRRWYPEASHTARGTGTLARRLRVSFPSSTLLIGIITNTAPHAHLWHWGTAQRRTAKGYNRGAMPAASPEPMVPIVRRRRAQMYRRMADLLKATGFQVTTD